QRIFDLIPTDVGRPFGDIATNLETPDWNELIYRVTDQLETVERDVSDRDGHWYSLRMRPYKTGENKIDGVLVALFDVHLLMRRRIESLIPERLREHHIKDRQHFFKEPKTRPMGAGVDLFGRKKDGREFPVEVSLSHIQSNQEVLAVAFITDVSARKQAETAL